MSELDHIIRTIPFDHLLLMLAGLAALDASGPSPSSVVRPSTLDARPSTRATGGAL